MLTSVPLTQAQACVCALGHINSHNSTQTDKVGGGHKEEEKENNQFTFHLSEIKFFMCEMYFSTFSSHDFVQDHSS